MEINTIIPGNYGFRIKDEPVSMLIPAGLTVVKGHVYQVDNESATAAAFGVAGSIKAVVAADALLPQTQYVLAKENGAAGEVGQFLFRGWHKGRMDAGYTPGANVKLGAAFGDTFAAASVEGAKVIAFNPEAATAAAQEIYLWFDGSGFGTFALFGTA